MPDESSMTVEDFTRRVWQRRHAMMTADSSAKLTGITVNYQDWISLVTDKQVGDPACRVHCKHITGTFGVIGQWFWEDVPLGTDSSLPVGSIALRFEVQA